VFAQLLRTVALSSVSQRTTEGHYALVLSIGARKVAKMWQGYQGMGIREAHQGNETPALPKPDVGTFFQGFEICFVVWLAGDRSQFPYPTSTN
jgi:hypothetical protein